MSVTEAGKVSADFDYHPDGQIASVTYADGRRENCLWDGLALIHRDGTELLNEPAVTGGNPVFGSESGVMFNDMLGTTLGIKGNDFTRTNLTAFGENLDAGDKAFFTGKPLVGELGYAFLFRNYRPEQGKWQTADPLGYPDGWNNFAYVNNELTSSFDWQGLCQDKVTHKVLLIQDYSVTIEELNISVTTIGDAAGYIYSVSRSYSVTFMQSHPQVKYYFSCGRPYLIDSYTVVGPTEEHVEGWNEYRENQYTEEELEQLLPLWNDEIENNIIGILDAWKSTMRYKKYYLECKE